MAAPFTGFPIPSEEITDLPLMSASDLSAESDYLLIRDSSDNADKKILASDLAFAATPDAIRMVGTFADLATTAALPGQIVETKGHTISGVGGQKFQDMPGSIVNNNGSQINNTVTAGRHWKAIYPKKNPYQFGFVDGGSDASVAINSCAAVYGEAYLDPGKTYNIQYAVTAKRLICEGGRATLNCTSPTSDNKFGTNNGAIVISGSVGSPLEGVEVKNVNVNCNRLKYPNDSAYIKGQIFYKLKNFERSGCDVIGCSSYAFWDWDTIGQTDYCSGTTTDCNAIDASVSFEQVNTGHVVYNNCYAYRSTAVIPSLTVEYQYHPYGGTDKMSVVYNNCIGVADGYVPSIFAPLLACKNITANDCKFINNSILASQVSAAVFLSNSNGNYDNLTFNNCILKSVNSAAVYLDRGQLGSNNARFKFFQCDIDGETVGVQFNGPGGIYSFVDCDVTGSTSGSSTPFSYYNNGSPTRIQVRSGSASAIGSAAVNASNLDPTVFMGTFFVPAGFQNPQIRQQKYGTATLINNTDHAYINVKFPFGVLDRDKVVILATVDAQGAAGGPSASYATPISWNSLEAIPGADDFRIYTNVSFATRKLNYLITEYV